MSAVFPIFAFPIYINETMVGENFEKELNFLKKQEYKNNSLNELSVNTDILNEPELFRCKEILTKCLDEFVSEVFCCEQQLYMTNSWAARTKFGQQHQKHNHPNSIVSGVFYLQTEEESSFIKFHRTPSLRENINLHYHIKKFNIFNSETWNVPIKRGQILIFPSSLLHSVVLNDTNNERVILGFNTFVKGKFGKGAYCSDLFL